MAETPKQLYPDNFADALMYNYAYESHLENLWWYYIGIPVLKLDPRTGEKADYINGQKVIR